MIRALLVAAGALALTGCASAQQAQSFTAIVEELKSNCHVTVSFQAEAGAMNPGSGVNLQGSADCPVPQPDGNTLALSANPKTKVIGQ